MIMHSSISALLLGTLLQLSLPAAAAPDSGEKTAADDERPRIGLVLGGGGARGAAHIGVLRELERLHIPIDAIAGTSMGAIVGGLYAAGKSPADLEEIVASLDWRASFTDQTPRRDLQFRRKQDDAAYPIRFELGLREGRLLLPRGLIQGQKLGHILRELTLATAGIESFDELPIPFRAVASDIETGEAYLISSNDLTRAMRASMSAPGIFAPVVVNGHTLVDGGLVGNVPVETMQSMGVDVIIAVDVEFPLYPPEQLQSALDITGQMLTILIRKETRRQLQELDEDDILIRPDLGQFGSTDFAAITEAIEPGAVATQQVAHLLQRYSLDETDWQQHLAARVHGPVRPYPQLDFVRVVDGAPLSTRVLESRLSTRPGDVLDPERLADDIASLYGLDLYEFVDYQVVNDGDQTGIEINAQPKSWGPNYLKFGMQLEDDFEGTTAFNLSARLTRAGVNRLGAEWRTDVQVGTEPLLVSEYYQPLSFDARYFIAPHIDLRQNNFRTFSGDDRIARYRRSESQFGIDIGRELGRWGEFRVGAFRGAGEARLKVGDPALPNFDFESGGLFANFAVDTLDHAQIPLHGSRVNLRWEMSRPGLGADNDSDTVSAELMTVNTWGRHTLSLGLDFGTTIQSANEVQNYFPLGGFLRMSGLARGEISGPHSGLARLVWYRESGETGGGVFDFPLYVGASIEAGNVWQRRSDISVESLLMSGSLFIGLDTYFGPLYLAGGLTESGKSNFYLSFGTAPR